MVASSWILMRRISGRIGTIHWRAALYDRTSMTTLCAVGSEAKVSNALP